MTDHKKSEPRRRGACEKHGMRKSKEYAVWGGMNGRCHNKNHSSYYNYGARGISVCKRWRESFINFYEDMGPRPSDKHSIDRINVNGNYEPKNCRWATAAAQQSNTRRSRFLTARGKTLTVAQWAKERKMTVHQIRGRVFKLGWLIEDALFLKVKRGQRYRQKYGGE